MSVHISEKVKQAGIELNIFEELKDFNYSLKNTVDIFDIYEYWVKKYAEEFENRNTIRNSIILFFYITIICVSFFGNFVVCKIVFFNFKRSPTNVFIANLSISDLLMTIFNLPLQTIKHFAQDWPLSSEFCKCFPFIQTLSVTVSSFTMACIAIDRYYMIIYPLKAKTQIFGILMRVAFTWILAMILSLPYSLFANVKEVNSLLKVTRCDIIYPNPQIYYRKIFTFISLSVQFTAPLMVSSIAYLQICVAIWRRKAIGIVTVEQVNRQREANWKTIKMLIVVLIVFVICWLPINVYHVYQDMSEIIYPEKHKSNVYFACHLIAMSSVCYNPFIYFWLNEKFRKCVKAKLHICDLRKMKDLCLSSSKFSKTLIRQLSVHQNNSSLTKSTNYAMQSQESDQNKNDSEKRLLKKENNVQVQRKFVFYKSVPNFTSNLIQPSKNFQHNLQGSSNSNNNVSKSLFAKYLNKTESYV